MKKKCSSCGHAKMEKKEHHKVTPKTKAAKKKKVEKVMHEFGAHELHSGSKKGPVVTNAKQAVAIALHESGQSKKKKHKK